ncbi:hypothetical protein [Candidatus Epulonipiscium viviparus]|uniref:hypothetical protein n=1 Tax=Candidatus Epulonipiscium viviparus TaxID=420336 RepID=UPI0027380861|nr:hypothetical protein [Candidatus Epulopiscium viviparus]
MKKFITLAIAGIISAGSFGSVMAAAPASLATSFNSISFEDGEAVNWQVTGPNATSAVVTSGSTAGLKALQVNMTSRATDANNITRLTAKPSAGSVWNIGVGTSIAANVTNPGTELIQLRATVKDAKGNSRMAYFSIAGGASTEIVLDPVKLGSATPGVTENVWSGDGYAGKGIDPSCITSIEFYFSEAEAVVMKGVTSASYIIDNIRVVQPAAILTFPTTSFEPGESNWSVTGAAPIKEIVATGAVDGTNALKITVPERQSDWSKITKLNIIPAGQTWDMGAATMITAHVTNDNDYLVQIRANIIDADKNTRMVYFTIPPKTNKEIVIDAERLGTPGVQAALWKGDGYSGKGVNKNKITALEFFVSEPEAAVMKDITSFSYIIDNVRAK